MFWDDAIVPAPMYKDGLVWLRMVAWNQGDLILTCRTYAPDGYRISCCCECAGCCGW